jgi:hypothetical protein
MKHWLLAFALFQAAAAVSAQEPRFLCGGVGEDARTAFKAEAAKHDLVVTFAAPTGALLSNVEVEISAGGKPVLQAHCNAPMMIADLGGKGSYEVKAAHDGKVQTRKITLGSSKPVNLTFVWPAS